MPVAGKKYAFVNIDSRLDTFKSGLVSLQVISVCDKMISIETQRKLYQKDVSSEFSGVKDFGGVRGE